MPTSELLPIAPPTVSAAGLPPELDPTAAEADGAMVWIADATGEAEYYSRRFLDYCGLSPGDAAAWVWTYAVHPNDFRSTLQMWQRALRNGTTFAAEFRLRRADGVYRRHQTIAVPERDRAGQVCRWVATLTEVAP